VTITIEELRKVYSEAVHSYNDANLGASGIDAGLLAVARYVAERQRAVEPTEEMLLRGGLAVSDIYAKEGGWCGVEAARDQVVATYRAMQSVAPSVVPE
jgi:hypothetical protein